MACSGIDGARMSVVEHTVAATDVHRGRATFRPWDGEDETAAPGAVTTSAAARRSYPIAPGYRLNVRSGPGTGYGDRPGAARTAPTSRSTARRRAHRVSGPYGTSNIWDNIGNGQFVSDAYVNTGSDGYVAPRC